MRGSNPKKRAGLSTRILRRVPRVGRKTVEQFEQVAFVRRLLDGNRMWPVAAPDAAVGCGLDQALRQWHDIIPRRTRLRELFGQRQHHPEVAAPEQVEDADEARVAGAPCRIRAAHVVEQHRHVERFEGIELLGDAAGLGLHLHVPAQLLHAGECTLLLGRREADAQSTPGEARAAHAGIVKPLQVGIVALDENGRIGAAPVAGRSRSGIQALQRVQHHGMVGAVGGRPAR